jgi:2-keto-3-deoxy-L-fuconate dehydrogenase
MQPSFTAQAEKELHLSGYGRFSPFVGAYLEKYHRHEKEKVRAELHQRQPIGRMGTPEEIAGMCLYLASPEASFVHGSVLTIDGGWTAA